MNNDAILDELLSPKGLNERLLSLGLKGTQITYNEFILAQKYINIYSRLSKYDCTALAIAKERNIILLTGDKALRKAVIK